MFANFEFEDQPKKRRLGCLLNTISFRSLGQYNILSCNVPRQISFSY